jgi:hypothetical protein
MSCRLICAGARTESPWRYDCGCGGSAARGGSASRLAALGNGRSSVERRIDSGRAGGGTWAERPMPPAFMIDQPQEDGPYPIPV